MGPGTNKGGGGKIYFYVIKICNRTILIISHLGRGGLVDGVRGWCGRGTRRGWTGGGGHKQDVESQITRTATKQKLSVD